MFLWFFFGLFVASALFLLIFSEVRIWIADRRIPSRVRVAHWRLARRALGATLLLAILMLLRYPAFNTLSSRSLLVKLLACLALCCAEFVVVIRDYCAVLRDLRRQSAQELHDWLHTVRDSQGTCTPEKPPAAKDQKIPDDAVSS